MNRPNVNYYASDRYNRNKKVIPVSRLIFAKDKNLIRASFREAKCESYMRSGGFYQRVK